MKTERLWLGETCGKLEYQNLLLREIIIFRGDFIFFRITLQKYCLLRTVV